MGFFDNLGSMISGGMSDLGKAAQERPEMYGMLLDSIGTGIAPDNAMAGIAQRFGSSILADKELQAQRKQQTDWMDLVKQMISGQMPLTPAELEGVTKMSLSPGKNGRQQLTLGVTMPEALKASPSELARGGGGGAFQTPQTPSYKNFGSMISDPF